MENRVAIITGRGREFGRPVYAGLYARRGVMAEMLCSLGFPSRSQTNADSDVLHVPVTLLAGLGELSRIGEVILNPFIGPRLKTVVLTTDIPLESDKPVDFGLQKICSNCWKCARECPCDAIS